MPHDAVPRLSPTLEPPLVCGAADLTHFAYGGHGAAALLARIDAFHDARGSGVAARLYDSAIAYQLGFRRTDAMALQAHALANDLLYRVHGKCRSARPLRLLAICGAGDLMVNTPLDFLTRSLDVRLDLLHVLPGVALPVAIPDHDLAFFALSDADPPMLARLSALYKAWPRPALNDPMFLPAMARDVLARSLAGMPGVCAPAAVAVMRAQLEGGLAAGRYPCLVRPITSHAGIGLERLAGPEALAAYLAATSEQQFYLTAFEDYRSADGLYRKLRIAFIDRVPFLCHMAVSEHWMVHYLNAGMTDSATKRADEARAMTEFDNGFAARHAAAFEALHERLGFELYSIDCGEMRDGRLLVFEADTAAILHLMDPGDLFPYKPPQMARVFAAFDQLLRRHAVGQAAYRPLARTPLQALAG